MPCMSFKLINMCLGQSCVSFRPFVGAQEGPEKKKKEGGLEGVGTHLPYFFSILWGKLIRYTTGLDSPYPCRITGFTIYIFIIGVSVSATVT